MFGQIGEHRVAVQQIPYPAVTVVLVEAETPAAAGLPGVVVRRPIQRFASVAQRGALQHPRHQAHAVGGQVVECLALVAGGGRQRGRQRTVCCRGHAGRSCSRRSSSAPPTRTLALAPSPSQACMSALSAAWVEAPSTTFQFTWGRRKSAV